MQKCKIHMLTMRENAMTTHKSVYIDGGSENPDYSTGSTHNGIRHELQKH